MIRSSLGHRPLVALLAVGGLSCATSAVPPALSPEEEQRLATTRLPYSVGVERYEYPVYSESLLTSLQATRLFEEVRRLEEIEAPDLIASVRRPIYGTASIAPLLTIVTLGVVPTVVDEEWGESFVLRSGDSGADPVEIEFSYSGPTTLGWVALLRALSPRHALGRADETPRFERALAAAIAERQGEIERLAGEESGLEESRIE